MYLTTHRARAPEGTWWCPVSRCAVLGPRCGYAPVSSANTERCATGSPATEGGGARGARYPLHSARLSNTKTPLPLREGLAEGQESPQISSHGGAGGESELPPVRSLVTKRRLRGHIQHHRRAGLQPVPCRTTCSWRGVRRRTHNQETVSSQFEALARPAIECLQRGGAPCGADRFRLHTAPVISGSSGDLGSSVRRDQSGLSAYRPIGAPRPAPNPGPCDGGNRYQRNGAVPRVRSRTGCCAMTHAASHEQQRMVA